MFNSEFKVVYLVLFVVIAVVRKIWLARFRRLGLEQDRQTGVDLCLLFLGAVGMVVPLVYVFAGVLDFADYARPAWIGWAGVPVFLAAIWLLHRSHADLGHNWTATLGIRPEHTLVTQGVFRHIRHPMYAAHLVWALAQGMILPNWVAGPSFLLLSAPLYLLRIPKEERMMIETFPDTYPGYMARTGRVLPRWL